MSLFSISILIYPITHKNKVWGQLRAAKNIINFLWNSSPWPPPPLHTCIPIHYTTFNNQLKKSNFSLIKNFFYKNPGSTIRRTSTNPVCPLCKKKVWRLLTFKLCTCALLTHSGLEPKVQSNSSRLILSPRPSVAVRSQKERKRRVSLYVCPYQERASAQLSPVGYRAWDLGIGKLALALANKTAHSDHSHSLIFSHPIISPADRKTLYKSIKPQLTPHTVTLLHYGASIESTLLLQTWHNGTERVG